MHNTRMANDIITNYLAAQSALMQEKERLEKRLVEITRALNQEASAAAAPAPVAVTPTAAAKPVDGRRKKMSPAARAKIGAAAKARWAIVHAAQGGTAAPAAASAAPKTGRRKMSAAARANMTAEQD